MVRREDLQRLISWVVLLSAVCYLVFSHGIQGFFVNTWHDVTHALSFVLG